MTREEMIALEIGDMIWNKDGRVRELVSEFSKDPAVNLEYGSLWTRPAYFSHSTDSLDISLDDCGQWNTMPKDINDLPQNVVNTLIWLKLSYVNSKLHKLSNQLQQAARWD